MTEQEILSLQGVGPVSARKIREAVVEQLREDAEARRYLEDMVHDLKKRLRNLEDQLYGEEDEDVSGVVQESP